MIVHIASTIWINLYGFGAGLLDIWLFGGLVTSTFTANLLRIAVVVVGLLFGVGRLRPRDVGLHRRQVATALLGGLIVWVVLQLIYVGTQNLLLIVVHVLANEPTTIV